MTPRINSIKQRVSDIHAVGLRRHRGGEDARRVVQGISDGMDGLLRAMFTEDLLAVGDRVALLAVGGYGRRELCPHSDVDLMFLCEDLDSAGEAVERFLRTLWDSGIDLGHSVRTPSECLRFMKDDDVTAATLLESRFLAGSEKLMRRFQEKSLNRYTKLHGEKFASKKLAGLRKSIEGEGRTIFVTEPHIKEGACCMRDVQHILWIERLRRQATDFESIAHHGGFSFEDVRNLENAYTFFLRVRCELHFLNNLRQDILELESQVDVARNLGYEDDGETRGVEKLMSEYYRHARNVLAFSKYYIETKSRGTRFLEKLRHRFLSSKVGSSLSLHGGRLYFTREPTGSGEVLAERIIDLFLEAQRRDANLSQSVCQWIRRTLSEVSIDFSRSETIDRAFLSLLAGRANTGRILTLLNETGVLGRIIPEFSKLNCLVTFDGHHQFTADEHTLRMLRELDRIESQPDYPESELREVFERIPDRLPLRLAVLLHDIGKSANGGRHDAVGTEAAVVICERLGLDERTIHTVEFLVYRHLAMFRASERMDFNEEGAISKFAQLVKNREQLDMLYLLTYIDIKCVGAGTWTAWKGAQLSELYQKTSIHLETGELPAEDLGAALSASGIDTEDQERIREHCHLIDNPAYPREHIPERMLDHLAMIDAFIKTGSAQVGVDETVGSHQVTFCARDRAHLFADLTGVLVSEGLNILGARLYSRSDGVALDCFQVVPADKLRVTIEKRVNNVRKKLEQIEKQGVEVSELVLERSRRYRFRPARRPLFPPRVVFLDDDLSSKCTVIEVDAGDRPGLLHELATAIADCGLDLRTAKVSTMIDRARDVFHVTDGEGRKITDDARRAQIKESLERAAEFPGGSLRRSRESIAN